MGCEEAEVDDYIGSTTEENFRWVLLEIKGVAVVKKVDYKCSFGFSDTNLFDRNP